MKNLLIIISLLFFSCSIFKKSSKEKFSQQESAGSVSSNEQTSSDTASKKTYRRLIIFQSPDLPGIKPFDLSSVSTSGNPKQKKSSQTSRRQGNHTAPVLTAPGDSYPDPVPLLYYESYGEEQISNFFNERERDSSVLEKNVKTNSKESTPDYSWMFYLVAIILILYFLARISNFRIL